MDLKDAFVGSGKGVGRTFVNKLPALRIDYIFHSPVLNRIILKRTISTLRPPAGFNRISENTELKTDATFLLRIESFIFNLNGKKFNRGCNENNPKIDAPCRFLMIIYLSGHFSSCQHQGDMCGI
jgi:hypothetical protein